MDSVLAAQSDAELQAETAAARRRPLRLLTCGSVDSGKSTLIGRLLYDTGQVPEDQLAELARESRRRSPTGGDLDLALLVDGLEAEREQGITIDVAYRYFSTPRRSFIIADTPGHEQYTRNMATGASTSDLAVLLVDARKGLLVQTQRHIRIAALLGIRHVALLVNKMDLAEHSETAFTRIEGGFRQFSEPLGFASLVAVPVSARFGDNIVRRSDRMTWYAGPTVLQHLESVDVDRERREQPFRFPVQMTIRADPDFRGLAGTVASGRIRPGDVVAVAGSERRARVDRIVTFDGDRTQAEAGDAVVLVLAEDMDIARGDMLAAPDAMPEFGAQMTATIIWMAEQALLPGRSYLLRSAARTVPVSVTLLKHRIDIRTGQHVSARTLRVNELGIVNLHAAAPLAFDAYAQNRTTGAFVLIDRDSNATIAAGTVEHGLRRAANIRPQRFTLGKSDRAALKGQKPLVLWFTGLPGSGKSTIANLVEGRLHARHLHTMLLDGDNLRLGLTKDLGFTDADRVENMRRMGEVAKLFVEAGLIVLCSLISPFRAERRMVRGMVGPDEFLEVFVDAPLDLCIARDPKGLYRKALDGFIPNFTGIGSPYEPPDQPGIHLDTREMSADLAADHVVAELERRGFL